MIDTVLPCFKLSLTGALNGLIDGRTGVVEFAYGNEVRSEGV
jgi:hypothetical protein